MPKGKRLEVILKVSEVCNIACTYCYYYLSGDDRPLSRPARIDERTTQGLVRFLNEARDSGGLESVQIDLHGGEPLMVGKPRFKGLCDEFRLGLDMPYRLCITTNAMLLDDEWLDILSHYGVAVCVSIDGPKHVHDPRRIDKRGKGTYDRVVAGLRRLQAASRSSQIAEPSALCVVDPSADAGSVYQHLVHELGLRSLDFLMPDVTHDSPDIDAPGTARFMDRLMECWLADDDPSINIRVLKSTLSLLVAGRTYLAGFGSGLPFAITVASNGDIDSDDFLKPCGVDQISTPLNISTATLDEVLRQASFDAVGRQIAMVPDDCLPCEFSQVCAGGQATHRFSRDRGFNNKSVYCAANYAMFRRAAGHLLRSGVPLPALTDRLLAQRVT